MSQLCVVAAKKTNTIIGCNYRGQKRAITSLSLHTWNDTFTFKCLQCPPPRPICLMFLFIFPKPTQGHPLTTLLTPCSAGRVNHCRLCRLIDLSLSIVIPLLCPSWRAGFMSNSMLCSQTLALSRCLVQSDRNE